MVLILKLAILLYLIINIINLKKVIVTKNKKDIIYSIILSTIVVIISFASLENLYNLDVGLETLVQGLLFIISLGLLVISSIVGLIKYKKSPDNNKNNIKDFVKLIILMIIPIIALSINCLREKNIINNGEIILVFNYQGGMIQSDYYTFVANEKSIKQITVGHDNIEKYTKYTLNKKEYLYYNIKYNNSDKYEINSYQDEELTQFSSIPMDTIINDAKTNHNDNQEVVEAYIYKFGNSNYYLIEQSTKIYDSNNLLHGINILLYKNNKYIGEVIGSTGDITEIYLINKNN